MAELKLDLTRHCVETAIRRSYNQAVSDYFRANKASQPMLETIIDMTRQALETLDFKQLRGSYAPLAGHSDKPVVLMHHAGRLAILIDGDAIALNAPDGSATDE
ncbi:MAG: hypothetical protein HKP58_06545 [Desulfatitalea sp.]|nr:hypothetical protein [Desulfatitalea sp.]NNK00056.1 hypothetical protein [Desulfatitalea sp.]